jgi:two-component system, NarL family, invasion response regulator UvrY
MGAPMHEGTLRCLQGADGGAGLPAGDAGATGGPVSEGAHYPSDIDVPAGWPGGYCPDSISGQSTRPVATPTPAPQPSHPPSPSAVGVLVVDDQPPFLVAARRLIELTPGFEAVGEATSGECAVTLAATLRPDLVLIDVRMPGLDGLGAARCITSARSASAVVLVSTDPEDVPVEAAEECGAVAVIGKQHLRPTTLAALWQRCAARVH